MTGNTKLSDLTVDEYKEVATGLLKDVPPDHFMEAVDKLFWKYTKQLGIELTGKDITNNNDVLCIRKTFDDSQKSRLQKEKVKDTLLTQSTKKIFNVVVTIVTLSWLAALSFLNLKGIK